MAWTKSALHMGYRRLPLGPGRGYYSTHEWAKGQCLVHSSHVSMRYYLDDSGEHSSQSKTLVALTHDVTVYTGALPSMRELDEIDAGRPQSSSQCALLPPLPSREQKANQSGTV